ncbi:MAG: pilus assembly protein PilM [Clostridiaceae bacterium]|nr:pilus assembly protein PilM [Clostridiaceae bacterium]
MKLFKRSSIGMEIDSKEIRIVHLKGLPEKPVLCTFAQTSLPEGVVRDGKVYDPERLGRAIAELWEREKIKCRDVILGVNNQDVIIRFAVVPELPKDKLYNLIHFQSMDYIPVPIDEIELDYEVIGHINQESGRQLKLLLVAGRKRMLFDYIKALEAARLNILDISVSMLAMTRIIPNDLRDKPVVLINLSYDFGNIVIMNGNEPGMARTFAYPSGLRPYLSAISGLKGDERVQSHEEAVGKISSFIDVEVRSSVQYYKNQYPDLSFQNILVTGTLSKAQGLIHRLRNSVETDISPLGLSRLENHVLQSTDGAFSSSDYTVCLSLALCGLEV